ncbi:hypothetical protein EVAR_35616_1 [Eumeta japonica]|uniref:Uncharacterized protein n=1 Tax=Eumeta variegata TaxID=151549 RepID=A0A4C1WFU4_EUMVA|nr:hypothetical protein EVAR_35616_1 [Eumeta japonica]
MSGRGLRRGGGGGGGLSRGGARGRHGSHGASWRGAGAGILCTYRVCGVRRQDRERRAASGWVKDAAVTVPPPAARAAPARLLLCTHVYKKYPLVRRSAAIVHAPAVSLAGSRFSGALHTIKFY